MDEHVLITPKVVSLTERRKYNDCYFSIVQPSLSPLKYTHFRWGRLFLVSTFTMMAPLSFGTWF